DADAFDVTADRVGYDDVDIRDELFHRNLVLGGFDGRAPAIAEAPFDLERFALDDLRDAARTAENVLQLGDRFDQLGVLVFDFLALETDQRAQPHVDDRLRLHVGEAEAFPEPAFGFVGGLARAHDLDDFVDIVERDPIAFEQMRALLGFAQIVLRTPRNDVASVRDKMLEQLFEGKHLRLERHRAVGARLADRHEREHVEPETRLQRRMLEKLIEDDLRRCRFLQLDNDAHAFAIRLVVETRDAGNALFRVSFGDSLDDSRFVDLVGNLGNDDFVLTAILDDFGLAANRDGSASGPVGFAARFVTENRAPRGKIGALDDVGQQVVARVGVVDQRRYRVGNFAEVVRRDVGRHSDGDAGRTVDEQLREATRQNGRLDALIVEVGNESDGLFVDIGQHFERRAREPGLGVAIRRRRVGVDRTKVAVAVD